MRRKYTLLLVLIIFNLSALLTVAQDSTQVKPEPYVPLQIKLNVLSLADYTPSIQVAIQYNVFKNLHIQHEAGYITHHLSPYWNSDSEMEGFRLKNQLKYYIFPEHNGFDNFYAAAEFMYKKSSNYEEQYFSMFDNAYFQRIRYHRTKEVFAYSLLLGFEPVLTENNFLFDFFAGMGYRRLNILEDFPADASAVRWDFFSRRSGSYHLPGFYFGFRMGYKLKI